MVTFTPNVNKVFEGENIVMTCNVESILQGDAAYYWYRDGEWVQTRRIVTISSAEMRDGGDYHCWTKYTKGSDALRLDVSNGKFSSDIAIYTYGFTFPNIFFSPAFRLLGLA